VCNLYSITTNQAAIAVLLRVVNRYLGNLASMSSFFRTPTSTEVRRRDLLEAIYDQDLRALYP
jgi:hypothetical protein